jgi:hypothetical protein
MLDRHPHERLEQFLEDDLAGHGLRDFEHGREVQVFDWGSFVFFSDPDGNGWAVQQLPVRD